MRLLFLMLITASLTVACSFSGLRSPGPTYAEIYRKTYSEKHVEVDAALRTCGWYSPRIGGAPEEDSFTVIFKFQECMSLKGFTYPADKEYGNPCDQPLDRDTYAVCKGVPVRIIPSKLTTQFTPGESWIKSVMTEEERLNDWKLCGGGEGLKSGYKKSFWASDKENFDQLTEHLQSIRNCMTTKGYNDR